jgi:hypothetical protein
MVRDRRSSKEGAKGRSGVVFRDEGTGGAIGTIYYVDKNATLRLGNGRSHPHVERGPPAPYNMKKHMSTTSAKAFAGAEATSRPFTTGQTLRTGGLAMTSRRPSSSAQQQQGGSTMRMTQAPGR